MDTAELIQREIETVFRAKLLGKAHPDFSSSGHDGAAGNWLESQFGVEPNSSGKPDFKGYELKKETKSVTTFGDWSADAYAFSPSVQNCTRDDFLKVFGSPNPQGRFSWSGSCVPKVGSWNLYGQTLEVNIRGDIFAIYNFAKDMRPNKWDIVPNEFQTKTIALAIWNMESLRNHVEEKFNMLGWFSVRTNKDGHFDHLVFGQTIDFSLWVSEVKRGIIYLDSGMMQGNSRNYSQWRASNTFWDSLIIKIIR